ncbi:MAG: WG repeat-containing protein [Candidatus Obscuribacter sp.]|nr:WG repeat-containing protein [Candidatus Obscuribacter sp.]
MAAAQDPLSHRFGYIDKSGHWAIPARYYAATPFYKGLAPASVSKGLFPLDEHGYTKPYSIIDKTGKETLLTNYFRLYPLFRGHLWALALVKVISQTSLTIVAE